MLSTMLVREVDDPIFEQTRQWIERDPDAYFYLILDELHLHCARNRWYRSQLLT